MAKLNKKKMLLAASVAGLLAVSGTVAATAVYAEGPAAVNCMGVNACKGKGMCGGTGHACAGKNTCKGAGMVTVSGPACDALGGTV